MFTTIISLLTGLFKAIPVLADLWEKYSDKRTKAKAAERHEAKDSAVDAAIDAAARWVPASDAEQLAEADEKARLRASSTGSPGVGEGRAEDH